MGATPNELTSQRHPGQRRSQRILLKVGILVRGARPDGKPFSEKAFTSVVSAHGALILLRESVTTGQQLNITHVSASEETAFRVVEIYGAHAESGTTQVGVEFVTPSPRFWHVAFPPPDWNPRMLEAKSATTPTVRPAKLPPPAPSQQPRQPLAPASKDTKR